MGERSSGGFVNVFNRLNSSRVEPKQRSTAGPEMAPQAKTTTSNGRTNNKLSLLNNNNQSKGTRVTVRTSRSNRKSDEPRTKSTNKFSSKNRVKSRSLPSALLKKNRNKYENGDDGDGDGDGDEDQPEHDSQNIIGIDNLLKLNDSTSWMDSFVVSEASLSLNDSGSSLNFSSNLLDASNPDMEDSTTEVGASTSSNNKTKPIKHPPVSVPRKKNRIKSPKSSPRSSPKQQQITKVSKHQPLSSVIPPALEAASSDTILSSTRSARAKLRVRSNSASNLESSPTSKGSPATTNTRVKKHPPLSGSEMNPAVDASRGRKGKEDSSPPRRRSRSAGVIRTQKKVGGNSSRRKASSPHPIDRDFTKARTSYQSLDTANTSKSSTSSRSGKKKSYKKEKDSNSKRSGRLTDLLKRSNSAGNLQTQSRKKISSGKLQEKEKVLSKRSSRMADLLKRSNSAQHLLEELEIPPKPSSSSDLPPLSPSALKRSSSVGNLQEKTSTKTSTKRSVRPGKVKRSNSADYFPGDEPGDRQQQEPERPRTPRRSARNVLRRSSSAQHLPEDLGGQEKVKMSRRTVRALKRSNSAGNINEQTQEVAQGKENGSSTPSAHPTTSSRIKYSRSSSAGNLNPRKKDRPTKRASSDGPVSTTDDAKSIKRDTALESPSNDNNRDGCKEQPKRKGILDAKISMFESMSPNATKKQRSPGESSIKSYLSASKGVEKFPTTNKKTPPTSANTSASTSVTTEDTRSTLLQYLSDLPLESASSTQDFKPPSSNHQDSLPSHHHHHHASQSSPGSPKRRGIGYTDSLQPEQLHDSSHSLSSTASSKRKKKVANDSQRPDFNDSSHSLGSVTSSSSKRKKKGINLDSVPPELHDSSHSLGSTTSSSRRKNKGLNSTRGKPTSDRNVAGGAEQIVGLNDEISSPSTIEKRRPKSSRRKSKSFDAAFDTFQSKPAAPLKKKKSPRQPTRMLDESEIKSASSPTEDSNRSLPVSPPLDTAPTTKADNNEEKVEQVSPEEWWELEKEKMSNEEEKAENNSNENPEEEISPEEWWKLETEKMIAGESKTEDATKIEDEDSPSGRKRSGNMSSRISNFETNKSGDGISTTLAVNGVLSPRNTQRKSKSMESTRLAPILSPRATKKSTETKIDADLSRTPKSKQRTSKSSREKSKRSEENVKGDVKPTEKEAASKRKSADVPSNQSANEDKNSQPSTPTKPHSEEKAQNVGMSIKDRLAMFNKACAPPPSDPARTRRGFLTPRLVKKKKALGRIDEQSTNEPPVENTGPKATSKEPEDDPRKRLKKTVSIEKTNSFNRKHLLNAASDVHDQRNRLKESRSRSGLQEFVPHRGDEFHKAITAKTDEDFTSFIPPQFAKSESEVQLIKTALEKNFIFEHLELDDIERLVAAFQPFEVPKGETIIKQGDDGDYFYVIASGEVTYHIINRKVGMAGKGKTFGEMALIYTCPRTASVKAASEPTSLFRVDQKTFRYVIRSPTRTSREEKEKLLRGVTFMSQLGDADIERLCSVMTPLDFEAGDFIVQKGDEGDSFFILKEGEAKVADFVMGNTRYEDVTLKAGDYFGEGALNSSEPRVADVVALTKGSAFSIDRATFQKVLGDFENLVSRAQDWKKLNGIKMFKELGLSSDDLDALVGLVINKEFKANELICKEGHTFDAAMFFVRSGTVRISSHDGYRNEEIKAGGYFGVEHLLVDALSANKSERSLFEAFGTSESSSLIEASCTAMICSDGCTLGVLSLEDCRTVFDTTSINFGGVSSDLLSRRATIQQNIKKTLNLEDLNRDSILGEGQFGEVWRVTTVIDGEDSPQEFALKIQSTNDPIREDSALEAIHREMYILKKLNHPFIVGLVATYECNDYVYMLMEVVKGGELWSVIHVEDENGDWTSGISETDSKFYSFIVADTLAYMHRQKIVFRDLKPENVLIDHEGYPILVDFGFAKVIGGTTYTFCGTPNYLAPEIVMNSGHGFAADHWALGVIMYEMVCGENPFYYDDMDQITLFKSIVQDRMYPMPEEKASPDMVDIVERLLEKHPIQRLGSLANGSKGILKHKWFDQLDVNKVRNKEAKAPWLPPPK